MLAEDARRVRLVDQQQRVVAAGEVGQPGQRRQVAVHAEDRVGDDQAAPGGGPLAAQQVVQVVEVAVAVDVQARPATGGSRR